MKILLFVFAPPPCRVNLGFLVCRVRRAVRDQWEKTDNQDWTGSQDLR